MARMTSMSRIEEIIREIKRLDNELLAEIEKKEAEFFYKIKGKKIYFEEEARRYQREFVVRISTYLRNASLLHILTVPFIWACIVPAALLDLAVFVYQGVCFRVYKIPKVQRSDYIVIDRHNLSYLNAIEKINCMYCGYFNGLIAYVQEIAARTEQYWCPIKHARKVAAMHSRYHKFLEYGDCKDYQQRLKELRQNFQDLEDDKM
jgi:hypothetical protein